MTASEALRTPAQPGGLRGRMPELPGLDLRSLALFRMGAALCIVLDLALRWPFLSQHYTDEGLLPRSLIREWLPEYASPLALHMLGGTYAYQVALFALTAICAVALGLGFGTRITTFLCWWLQLSLHMRDPFSLNGGNHQLRIALFWSLFLPLGGRWSLDARRRPPPATQELRGVPAAALVVQVAIIYFCAGIAKSSPQWIRMGNALQWVMLDPDYTRSLAQVAAGHPGVLRVLTFGTVGLELLAPIAFFVPWWNGPLRGLAVLGLIALQTGIGLTMRLGIFPLVSIAVLAGILPGWIWDWRRGARETAAAGAHPPPERRVWQRARSAFVALCLLWVVALNVDFWVDSFRLPRWFVEPGRWVKLDQYWNMYSGVHRAQSRWDMLGTAVDGEQVDLSHPGYGPRWGERVKSLERDPYWLGFQSNVAAESAELLKPALASFWCRQWNADAPPPHRLRSVELFYLARYLHLDGAHGPWAARSEGRYACPAEEARAQVSSADSRPRMRKASRIERASAAERRR